MSSPESRKTVINLLPQHPEAWGWIAVSVFFVSFALAINSVAGCAAEVSRNVPKQSR